MSSPPPAPRPAYRKLEPLPPGHRLVVPPPKDEPLNDELSRAFDHNSMDEESFQAMRAPPEEDQHDPEANAEHVCKCGSCLWYGLFYFEFLVDWYEAAPGQVPPHPMYISEDKLIKAAIHLFGYPTIPFPYHARLSSRPSQAVMERLDAVHIEHANDN